MASISVKAKSSPCESCRHPKKCNPGTQFENEQKAQSLMFSRPQVAPMDGLHPSPRGFSQIHVVHYVVCTLEIVEGDSCVSLRGSTSSQENQIQRMKLSPLLA